MFQIHLMYLFQSITKQKIYRGTFSFIEYSNFNHFPPKIEMNMQQKIISQYILLEYVKLQQGLTPITRYFVHKYNLQLLKHLKNHTRFR